MPLRDASHLLVYDVGMHNGDDAAYYLSQGHRVVAIEADLFLVDEARRRFPEHLASGRLKLLNVAIAAVDGVTDFWISDNNRVLNSMNRAIATREGARAHAVQVEARSIRTILNEFGVPYYLKVDIEGCDLVCIKGLAGLTLPRFISVESEAVSDREQLDEARSLATLEALYEIGYRKFKLVAQQDFWTLTGSAIQSLYRKTVRSAAHGRLRRLGLCSLGSYLAAQARLRRKHGYDFPTGSAGPWGDGTFGAWMEYESARRAYVHCRRWHFRHESSSPFSFWCDWHATF